MVVGVAGALVSAAGSAISSAIGSNRAADQAADARKQALKDQRQQFVRLRKAAEKGGFNPLTALGSGQAIAALPSGVPNLASNSAIREVFDVAANVVSGEAAAAQDRQEVRDQMERYELETMQSGGAGEIQLRTSNIQRMPSTSTQRVPVSVKPEIENYGTPSQNIKDVRPPTRPSLWSDGITPVIDALTGKTLKIPRKLAEQYELGNYELWDGDMTERLFSDLGASAVIIPKVAGGLNTFRDMSQVSLEGVPLWLIEEKEEAEREAKELMQKAIPELMQHHPNPSEHFVSP